MARRRLWRGLLAGAAVAGALTGAIGFAHTPAGRPVLGWLARAAGKPACPFGYDQAATPAQREAERARFTAAHKGDEPAAARPAFGFALDRTTRAEVDAWATAHGVACKAGHGPSDLQCPEVPDALVPAAFRSAGAQALWFVFGDGDRLRAVTSVAHAASPDPVSAGFRAVVADLDHEAGSASQTDGDPSPAQLASGALYQASAEYRFRDYYAVTRATNLGGRYVLTTEARSLVD